MVKVLSMQRKVFKSGNSIVVSLPKEYLDALNLTDGDKVSITLDKDGSRIVIDPIDSSLKAAGVDEEFAEQVAEFIDRYRPALEALAGK
jgi:putative addiction module antidote